MKRSPIAATLIALGFLVVVPVALFRRLSDGVFPTQAYDIVLGLSVIAWIVIAKAVIDRDEPMSQLVENRLSPSWQAHSLVEQGLFGVGLITKRDTEPTPAGLHRLAAADETIEDLLPDRGNQPLHVRVSGSASRTGVVTTPVLSSMDEPEPEFFETEIHVIGRGDTFWSIAEERLGDGRRWKAIEDLNVGREVAPGAFHRQGDSLRIGWEIIAPVPAAAVASDA